MVALYRREIEEAATKHQLPVALVQAVCQIESSGNRWAWNPEPRYRYLWDVQRKRPFRALRPGEERRKYPPDDFPALAGDRDQEWWGQQASWSLMQVMGAVAREYGFQEPYSPQLCEVSYALELGCTVLAHRVRWADGNLSRGLAAYNAGPGGADSVAGQAYAKKVLAERDRIVASGLVVGS